MRLHEKNMIFERKVSRREKLHHLPWCSTAGSYHLVLVVHVDKARLCLWISVTNGPITHPTGGTWIWRAMVKLYYKRKSNNPEKKTCLSVSLSVINPTLNDSEANPGLGGERPATNHLSHGTPQIILSYNCPSLRNLLRIGLMFIRYFWRENAPAWRSCCAHKDTGHSV
jgi:hypothetical protein